MEESLSDTAATVLSCPAGCPLALFSCENLFTADRNSLNQKVWHLAGTRQTWCYTLNFWSTQPSPQGFHHLIFPQCKCQARAARSICMQRHIMVSVWVLIVVGDVLHSQKDISRAVDKAKRERGWVTILHPGWSATTCGKTQYLHFAIRTTFFSLYFPQHRLHTSLCCGMLLYESWSVMACTCLLVIEWNAVTTWWVSPPVPVYQCSSAVTYYLRLALSLFVSIFCAEVKINIVFGVGGNSVALFSLQAGNNFEKWRNWDEQWLGGSIICQLNIYSRQMLSFISVSLIMALCFRHQSLLWGEKKWKGRFEDVVERMTTKGEKWDQGKRERLNVQREDWERGGFLVSEQQQARKRERKVGSRRRHGKSLSLEQSQELFANAAAPRQRLVWGWHAAVAGCVGVTSAPVPGGLKTQGCPSREEGHMQALTHCGNRAALAIWGPSHGVAYLEVLPESTRWARWKGSRNPPARSLAPFLFHTTLALFALSSLPFLCT